MRTTAVVIGAGHTGLAVSHYLSQRSVDHVVIERGEVANTWRTERWDSLRLLTPNWQSRLPGVAYDGGDPDGYMSMPEVVDFIAGYARTIDAPVQTNTRVTSVRPDSDGYQVVTDQGVFFSPTVVLATGGFNLAKVPAVADAVPGSIEMVTPIEYRRPEDLPQGGVLVVGASATGIQIAEEVHRSGRPVTLAVGEHVRLPRTYRGKDVMWWLDRTGILDERYDEVDDLVRARNLSSPQLVGTPERRNLDLNSLRDQGIRLVGRLAGIADGRAQLSGSLRNKCELADLKLGRLLDTFDTWAFEEGIDEEVERPHRMSPTRVDASPPLTLDLRSGEIATIIWATGYRPDYSWLHARVLDRKGQLRHEAGVVTDAPGLYRIGLNLLRRRKSSFIHGADDDARFVTDHLIAHLEVRATA
ncbi:MAG TPA: NAD(P)-binding domain-containing protein [Acidimicrobiia bacterium]|nr:NAD(P)-binding domain-containing protein [Acidimicrobiia bacterium]